MLIKKKTTTQDALGTSTSPKVCETVVGPNLGGALFHTNSMFRDFWGRGSYSIHN